MTNTTAEIKPKQIVRIQKMTLEELQSLQIPMEIKENTVIPPELLNVTGYLQAASGETEDDFEDDEQSWVEVPGGVRIAI